jgi:hypothetical protein
MNAIIKNGRERMPTKKSNVVSANLSDEAINILKMLGYLDGNKKIRKNMNLSKFISERILDHVAYDPQLNKNRVLYQVLLKRLSEAQKVRDKQEDHIKELAHAIAEVKATLNRGM